MIYILSLYIWNCPVHSQSLIWNKTIVHCTSIYSCYSSSYHCLTMEWPYLPLYSLLKCDTYNAHNKIHWSDYISIRINDNKHTVNQLHNWKDNFNKCKNRVELPHTTSLTLELTLVYHLVHLHLLACDHVNVSSGMAWSSSLLFILHHVRHFSSTAEQFVPSGCISWNCGSEWGSDIYVAI